MELLEVGTGPSQRIVLLKKDRISIGRSDDNDVVFTSDPAVSRRQAQLEKSGQQWRIRDLRSRNGTFVNGAQVMAPTVVNPGDRVTMGDSSFVLSADESAGTSGLLETIRVSASDGPVVLTARETETLRLLAQGLTDAQIADRLVISVKTVHSHLDRIRDKGGVRRRADLTRLAFDLGIAD